MLGEYSELQKITILLIFLMTAIIIIYSISLICIFVRKMSFLFKTQIRKFYVIVLFYILQKIAISAFIGLQIFISISNNWSSISSSTLQQYFKNALMMADSCLLLLFLIIFEYYMMNCLQIIISNQDTSRKYQLYFSVAQILYILASTILIILFNLNIVQYEVLNSFSLGLNSLCILLFLISFFYLNFLLTGILLPLRTNSKLRKIYKMLLILLLSRFLMTSIEFYIAIQIKDGNFQGFIQFLQLKQGQYVMESLIFIGYIVFVLLIEGLPVMYSLRKSVFIAFRTSNSDKNKQNELGESLMDNSELNNTQVYVAQYEKLNYDSFEELIDINIFSEIWTYSKGKYKNMVFFIKRSKFILSSYLLQEVERELHLLHLKNIKQLTVTKYFLHQSLLYLYEPFYHHNLDTISSQLTHPHKIQVLTQLIKSIQNLHKHQLYHGSLNPFNILVEDSLHIHISGLGVSSLKKYFSLTTTYSNKSIFTAVECFENKNSVVLKPNQYMDIYSFGIIVYELFTGNKQFRLQTIFQLQKKLLSQNFRPKIPQNLNPKIASLIRECWNSDPKSRPSVQQLIYKLKNIE